jgi:hypothetical protein
LGVEFSLNCPDRSWCLAQWAGTTESDDTDQAGNDLTAARRNTGTEGKEQKLLKEKLRDKAPRKPTEVESSTHRYRARLRSTPLRSARPASIERKNLTD